MENTSIRSSRRREEVLIRLQWGRKRRSNANKNILKEQCVTFHMDVMEKKIK